MFLRDFVPEILSALQADLSLVTTRVACDYYSEIFAFDEIIVAMRIGNMRANRVTMLFDYFRSEASGARELVASGEQQVACLKLENGSYGTTDIPSSLYTVLERYME